MKRNQIYEKLKITSLGYGGVGIAQSPTGKKIMVKGALPDSVVDVKIISKKKSYATAHIIHVHEVDKKWMTGEIKCPHYFSPLVNSDTPAHKHGCGGCKWQIMSYDKQLEIKKDMLEQCFVGLDLEVLPIIPSPQVYGYRNKIEFSFGKYLVKNVVEARRGVSAESLDTSNDIPEKKFSLEEHRQVGFHKQGQFSKVVDVDQCYLVSEKVHAVYVRLKQVCRESGLPVYDAKTNKGIFRHMMMREGVRTGHIMVCLSYASEQVTEHATFTKKWKAFIQTIKKDVFLQEEITTFVLIHNNGCADIVRGRDSVLETLWGEGRIFEELHLPSPKIDTQKMIVARFQISPASFFQTNTVGAEKLFAQAIEMIGEVKGNIVDLYCGSGTISITLLKAGLGKAVKGIEVVESAIYDAGKNAKMNGVQDRAEFYCGKAEVLLGGKRPPTAHSLRSGDVTPLSGGTSASLSSEDVDIGVGDFLVGQDLVIVDPPRDGLHPKVVSFLLNLKKEHNFRLLYISCNPTTLMRDLTLFKEGGWSCTSGIQPVDMFPQTHHVECIAILA